MPSFFASAWRTRSYCSAREPRKPHQRHLVRFAHRPDKRLEFGLGLGVGERGDRQPHGLEAVVGGKIVEVARPRRHGDESADVEGGFHGFRHAGIAGGRLVIIGCEDDAGVRVAGAQRLADGEKVAAVEGDHDRIASRGMERRAGGVAFADDDRGRTAQEAEPAVAAPGPAAGQELLAAVGGDELQ